MDHHLLCRHHYHDRYLDIESVPKRAVLEQLSLLAQNDEEKEKLLELASPEGADLYHEVCLDFLVDGLTHLWTE